MNKIMDVSYICIESKDNKPQWNKVNQILNTLIESYNFYITSDEFNNIFIAFEIYADVCFYSDGKGDVHYDSKCPAITAWQSGATCEII